MFSQIFIAFLQSTKNFSSFEEKKKKDKLNSLNNSEFIDSNKRG